MVVSLYELTKRLEDEAPISLRILPPNNPMPAPNSPSYLFQRVQELAVKLDEVSRDVQDQKITIREMKARLDWWAYLLVCAGFLAGAAIKELLNYWK